MLEEERSVPRITINDEVCKNCGLCASVCPFTASMQRANSSVLDRGIDPEECISCGQCAAICPSGALTLADVPGGTLHPVNLDVLPSAEHTLELLKTRRSIRTFEDTPVKRALIEQMIEGARFAPSAHNVQSTEFVVVEDKTTLHDITKLTAEYLAKLSRQLRNPLIRGLLSTAGLRDQVASASAPPMLSDFERVAAGVRSGRDEVLYGAPGLLLFHAKRSGLRADVNANLALHNAALMCEGLGMGCFYAGYVTAACDRDTRIQKLLKIPDAHKIYAVLAFGYPKYRFEKWMERNPPRITWM